MRVSVVGFGRMGARLCDAAERAGHEVAAVLDPAPEPYGAKVRQDLASRLHHDPSAFWRVPSDIVAIGTTAPSHAPLLEESLAHGFRRIIVEKPFACSVVEARRAVASAQAAGARVLVNHSRRYCPNFLKIARRPPQLAHLGRLRSFSSIVGGGSLGCVGVHFLDLCNMLFGAMPESVTCRLTEPGAPNVRGVGFDDPGGSAYITYPCAGRAFIDFSDDIGVYSGVVMAFEEAVLSMEDEFAPWRMRVRRPEDRGKPFSQNGLPLEEEAFPLETFSMMDRWAAMFEDAARDGPTVSGAEFGVQSLELYAALRWSAKTGRTLGFPLPREAEEAVYPIP